MDWGGCREQPPLFEQYPHKNGKSFLHFVFDRRKKNLYNREHTFECNICSVFILSYLTVKVNQYVEISCRQYYLVVGENVYSGNL